MAPIDSMGPFLIGNLLNYGLMGVLAVQVYFYTLAFPNDRLANKALVGVIMGLDIVQTSCATMYIWDIIIVGWGDVARIEHAPWSISTLPPTAGTVAFIAQSFFAWRVWILGTRRWPFVLIVGATLVTALASCAMSFCYGIALVTTSPYASRMFESNALMAWLATSIVCDLMITVTLSVQLWMKKQKTFHFVNHVVHRGVRMAIETGGLTCGVAIAELVLFLTPQSSYLHMLVIISGKIYSNSLLASLNSRAPIFRKDDPADEEDDDTYRGLLRSVRLRTHPEFVIPL
ncbi:hypothetical protein FPV67DRAFT_582646 [Lyophyllum atratum]|nr:hypothetical protein FPV67DRAFT_582646 [Lyophyllum atratum]